MNCLGCGEELIKNGSSVVVCWFCRERHEVSCDALPFEVQEVRPVIKSLSDPYLEKQNLGRLP